MLRVMYTATRCDTLQHTVAHCNTLQHTATHCNTLQPTATHCNTLQHTATHCNTLSRNATHFNALSHTATALQGAATILPLILRVIHTATHCNTLQQRRKGQQQIWQLTKSLDAEKGQVKIFKSSLGTEFPHKMAIKKGLGLFERTCVFTGIQFTNHFIEFAYVKTNELVCSNSNMTLTRQTCGQHSSRVAGRKRRALAFCFPYEFAMCS